MCSNMEIGDIFESAKKKGWLLDLSESLAVSWGCGEKW